MDIVKKTVTNSSGKMLSAKVSMDQPIGQNKNNFQLVKTMNIMIPKEQLEKSTLENWPQFFWVFNEEHSFFLELCPSDNFFNDFDPLFHAFAAKKFIFKENYVFKCGILQNNQTINQNSAFLL